MLAERDVARAFVSTGAPPMARAFAQQHAGDWPVLSDPTRAIFRLAGMRRSRWTMLHPRLVVNLVRALRRGFRQGRVQGDAWQLGGVIVVDAAGAIAHRQVDRVAGDVVDLDAVRAALRSLAPSRH